MTGHAIRLARADELPTLVAIDDAASELYAQAGFRISLLPSHPFVVAESVRWADAIAHGRAYVAVDETDVPVAFATLKHVDGGPYLDQLAVRPAHMRIGIGTALLQRAISWAGDRPLWLTTYAHLSWNAPYYQRHGFVRVAESACGPEMQAILADQRAVLPHPEQRIGMMRDTILPPVIARREE